MLPLGLWNRMDGFQTTAANPAPDPADAPSSTPF